LSLEKRRFKHWAYLNEEGLRRYGDIFGKEVPIVSMVPTTCRIEGKPEQCYMIYHEELTEEQLKKFLAEIAERFHVSPDEVKKHISSGHFEDRIPLRERFTNGAGCNHPGLFLP